MSAVMIDHAAFAAGLTDSVFTSESTMYPPPTLRVTRMIRPTRIDAIATARSSMRRRPRARGDPRDREQHGDDPEPAADCAQDRGEVLRRAQLSACMSTILPGVRRQLDVAENRDALAELLDDALES
jgi:hypothetical protein